MAQDRVDIRIRCPLCEREFFLGGAVQHRKKRHRDISMSAFVELIAKAKREGWLKSSKITTPGSGMDTATTALATIREIRFKGPLRISGGAFGVKR